MLLKLCREVYPLEVQQQYVHEENEARKHKLRDTQQKAHITRSRMVKAKIAGASDKEQETRFLTTLA